MSDDELPFGTIGIDVTSGVVGAIIGKAQYADGRHEYLLSPYANGQGMPQACWAPVSYVREYVIGEQYRQRKLKVIEENERE